MERNHRRIQAVEEFMIYAETQVVKRGVLRAQWWISGNDIRHRSLLVEHKR